MPSSPDDLQSETISKLVRKPAGAPWWLALLLVPALLAAILVGVQKGSIEDDLRERSEQALAAQGISAAEVDLSGRDATVTVPDGADADKARAAVEDVDGVRVAESESGGTAATPTDSAPPSTEPSTSQPPSGAFGVTRKGNQIEVTGTVPDAGAKPTVLDAAKAKAGSATVVDKLTIDAAAGAPDPTAVSGLVAAAAANKGDTSINYDGKTVTVSGQAPDQATKAAVGKAAAAAVPGATVANNLTVGAGTPPPACVGFQTKITQTLAQNKITFQAGTPIMTPASRQTVARVAALLKGCGTAKVEVGGHTDNSGNPATSTPLSQRRADAVKAELVRLGVAANRVNAKGYGEARPIASNGTEAGRVANRRVEIKVL